MTRAVMASRLLREVSVAGRRVAAVAVCVVVWIVVDAELDSVDLVATGFVELLLEEDFGLRPFVLVLNGLAVGARLIDVSVDICGEVAREIVLPEITTRNSDVARRRSSIYCTPVGRTALLGWVELSEMTGAGSFCCGAE
jgi:hypothetical protein